MSNVIARPFTAFARAAATDDGAYVVLEARLRGEPVTLAIPGDEVPRLLTLLSLAANDATVAQHGTRTDQQVTAIQAASCFPSARADGLVLKLHLVSGVHIAAFGRARRMAELGADMQALASFLDAADAPGTKYARH